MLQKINILINEISTISVKTSEELELFRLKYLSKKGVLSDLFEDFRNVPVAEKKEVGQKLNQLKQNALDKYNILKSGLVLSEDVNEGFDLSRPAYPYSTGSRHPISIVRNEITEIFSRIGFTVS